MKLAICGYPPLALQAQEYWKNSDIEFKFFITDFVSSIHSEKEDNLFTTLPPITFFEFRRLVNAGELDGVLIVEEATYKFTKDIVKLCELYKIPQVGVTSLKYRSPFSKVYWLNPNKTFIPYLNVNIVDGCILNCKACTHFAPFFKQDDIYPLENFRRDVQQLSKVCDVAAFYLLGGEPLLLKNLDEYIRIARQYMPKSNLSIWTNGLLLPTTSQKIFNALREEKFVVTVTMYAPTFKIRDQIKEILSSNGISFVFDGLKDNFGVFMTLHNGNDPLKAAASCFNSACPFMRDGKIYKCPPDALNYKFMEKFGIENFPASTGADIYAQNFHFLLQMLEGPIEMCYWCSENKTRRIPWEPTNNPQLEDWLADPDEIKNFSGGLA